MVDLLVTEHGDRSTRRLLCCDWERLVLIESPLTCVTPYSGKEDQRPSTRRTRELYDGRTDA